MTMTPQSRPVSVIITRPQPAASRFAAGLHDRFGERVRVVMSPLMKMRVLQPPQPDGGFGAVIFTSEAAVNASGHLAAWRLPKRAYCVGDRTAQVARDAGFDARSAQGDARDLIALIRQSAGDAPFLHLHGDDVAVDVARELQASGIRAQGIPVYTQEPQLLTAEALALLSGENPLILPIFSPRSAQIILQQCPARLNPAAQIICLSPAIAAVLGAIPCKIADHPDGPSMMQVIDAALIGA